MTTNPNEIVTQCVLCEEKIKSGQIVHELPDGYGNQHTLCGTCYALVRPVMRY